jgi:hypothetical protein
MGALVRAHAVPVALVFSLPCCGVPIRTTTTPADEPAPSLWTAPADLETRDLYWGPWGREHAPDAGARYRLVHHKHSGVNPGLAVRDDRGREWSVKQPLTADLDEGPVEVVLSRVLSGVGYHQPPVYHLADFTLEDDWGVQRVRGGRFRLKLAGLKDRGAWSWQQNPAVDSPPYQGLLVILLLFNGTDLKNGNNSVYDYAGPAGRERWLVVRDLGAALGTTGRIVPRKGDPAAFASEPFITGVSGGFVRFGYRGWHQELVRGRIRPADVGWACQLLDRLSDRQWHDAFRAGGVPSATAGRFLQTIQARLREGRRVAAGFAPAETR